MIMKVIMISVIIIMIMMVLFQLTVTVTAGGSGGDAMKEYIRKKGLITLQEKIKEYIDALKKGDMTPP